MYYEMEAVRVRGRAAAQGRARDGRSSGRKGTRSSPVVIEGRSIARTFWGKAWCDNLERYSDYANRLPRGRTYVRNGSVVDLQIAPGEVQALVSGSEIYKVAVKVAARAQGALDGDLHGLRGRHRLAGRAAAGALLQGRDGAHLPAEDRAVPGAGGDRALVQLPGLGVDVQARRGRALRHRRAARRAARAALRAAQGRPAGSHRQGGPRSALVEARTRADRVLADDGLSELFGLDLGTDQDQPASGAPRSASRPPGPRRTTKPVTVTGGGESGTGSRARRSGAEARRSRPGSAVAKPGARPKRRKAAKR